MNLWVDKYKPQSIGDIIGNKLQIKRCEKWLSNFKNKKENVKQGLLISGSPGIGKTTFANLLLKKYKYDVLEFNASDVRNQKSIKNNFSNILGKTSISKLMGGNSYNGIIMDEVDGLSLGDKGGLSELIKYLNPKKNNNLFNNPIICITNNDRDKKSRDLKKYCEYVDFIKPKYEELYEYANLINKKEKMKLSDDYILKIVNYSNNDVRKLISTLELFNKKKNENVDKFLINIEKDKNLNNNLYFNVIEIFDKYTGVNNILNLYLQDCNLINLTIHHNIINYLDNFIIDNKNKLLLIEKIYHCIAFSDIYNNIINYNHLYELQNYNGVINSCKISYLLNKSKYKRLNYNKIKINNIVFSNLLNKFSLELNNYKTKQYLLNKINVKSNFKNNDEIFYLIIIKIINYINNYQINQKYNTDIIKFVKYHNLEANDLEKIYKIVKLKIKKTNKENYYFNKANINIDKKYFTKFIKLL